MLLIRPPLLVLRRFETVVILVFDVGEGRHVAYFRRRLLYVVPVAVVFAAVQVAGKVVVAFLSTFVGFALLLVEFLLGV